MNKDENLKPNAKVIDFEKPSYKVSEYVENNFYGKFEIEPLERGFGTTMGNALRRVLLSMCDMQRAQPHAYKAHNNRSDHHD